MCPYYLSMGMTYEQYWDMSPYLVKAYRKAQLIKQKRQNEDMWLQGLYFYTGLCCGLQNVFRKKGEKQAKYPEKPFDVFKKTEAEQEMEADREREKAIRAFDALRITLKAKEESKGK